MNIISSNCLNFPESSPFCIHFKGILLPVRFIKKLNNQNKRLALIADAKPRRCYTVTHQNWKRKKLLIEGYSTVKQGEYIVTAGRYRRQNLNCLLNLSNANGLSQLNEYANSISWLDE